MRILFRPGSPLPNESTGAQVVSSNGVVARPVLSHTRAAPLGHVRRQTSLARLPRCRAKLGAGRACSWPRFIIGQGRHQAGADHQPAVPPGDASASDSGVSASLRRGTVREAPFLRWQPSHGQ